MIHSIIVIELIELNFADLIHLLLYCIVEMDVDQVLVFVSSLCLLYGGNGRRPRACVCLFSLFILWSKGTFTMCFCSPILLVYCIRRNGRRPSQYMRI
jgi:hypothetical protein